MHFRKIIFCHFVLAFCITATASCTTKVKQNGQGQPAQLTQKSARPAHWGYEGEIGPANWASLNPVYSICGDGTHQSPVNIIKKDVKGGTTWSLDYKTTSLRIAHHEHVDDIIDNGHTIQVTVDEGSTFTLEGKTYHLQQFHFHTPSEHTLDGKHLPMEMHLLHQSDDGSLAVIGVLFKEGAEPNENFNKLIANLPNAKGEDKHLPEVNLELNVHIPKDKIAYHYTGSLTTPPCSENVQWLILQHFVSLTPEQIREFSSRIGPNSRPVQKLNDRTVHLDNLSVELTH